MDLAWHVPGQRCQERKAREKKVMGQGERCGCPELEPYFGRRVFSCFSDYGHSHPEMHIPQGTPQGTVGPRRRPAHMSSVQCPVSPAGPGSGWMRAPVSLPLTETHIGMEKTSTELHPGLL